jgi:DNA-directed RNA polymerase specialized sigma24 family protein
MSEQHSDATPIQCPGGLFPQTRYSLVMRLGSDDPQEAQQALSDLCSAYRRPILDWVRQWLRVRNFESQAEDVTQEFLADLLAKNPFKKFVRGRVKFRTLLITCLWRFARDELEKARARKRGGGVEPLPLEDHEIPCQDNPDRYLDRQFATTVHERVLKRLEQKYAETGKGARFLELQRFILGDDPNVTYAEIGSHLGLKANAVKKAVFDLRDCYFEWFREEVSETVSPEALEEELKYLLGLLCSNS